MGFLIKRVATGQQSLCKSQCGVAMVEFAISIPFLLLMFVVVVEFGIMFYQQTTLNKAVQDGAGFLAKNSIIGQARNSVIGPQERIDAINLVVYGNIMASGSPLIDGFDTSMVTIECVYGFTATSTGTRCSNDPVINGLSPFSVSAQVQYSPVLGNMLTSLTGVNIAIPLKATVINTGY